MQAALDGWADLFETLSPDDLDRLEAMCAAEVRFKDPFNDVTGREAVRRVFEDMFETCIEPRFVVLDRAVSHKAGYLRWRFQFTPKRSPGRQWTIEGMSEVHFDGTGRVSAHIDHWDAGAQFYARLPVLGAGIEWVRRRLAVRA